MSRSKLFSHKANRTGSRTHLGCRCSHICLSAPESNRYFHLLERHPYLCCLSLCLLLDPLYFGGEAYVPQNALLLEVLAVLAVGAVVLWRLVRYHPQRKRHAAAAGVVFPALVLTAAWFYRSAAHPGLWIMLGGCCILTGLFWLTRKQMHNQRRRVSMLLLGWSFFLKFYYVFYTPITRRQHDVGHFGDTENHAGYISYLLEQHHLPDFDPRQAWQFYHPPLHHMISAAWLWLSETVFGIGAEAAQESLQTLSLFYAMAIVITAYRILRHFRLDGTALYIPLAIVAFHPSFILFSGSINNDALSVVFLMGAVLWVLKWYEKQTWEGIVKIALCIGLGMMTKLSAALAAIPTAAVFLVILVRQCRQKNWRIFGQFGVFAAICIPLGLWYPVRNLVRFGVPLDYVQEMPADSVQYLGDQSFFSRCLDFSPHQFASVFEQWQNKLGTSYNEYNPLIAMLKNAMFGEYINVYTLNCRLSLAALGTVLFWLGVLTAAIAFGAMVWLCWQKRSAGRLPGLFLVLYDAVMLGSFYKLAASSPFTCSMNFRYITPTCVIGAVFLGLLLRRLEQRQGRAAQVVQGFCVAIGAAFAVCAAAFYVGIGLV